MSDKEMTPVGLHVEHDTLHGTGQCDATDKQNHQYDVGKQCREVDHFAWREEVKNQNNNKKVRQCLQKNLIN